MGQGHPPAKAIRILGALSLATLLLVGLFYLSEDLRTSLIATATIVSNALHLPTEEPKAPLAGRETVQPVARQHEVALATIPEQKTPAAEPRVITTVVDKDNKTFTILDEHIPGDCYAEAHADYAGYAVQWGLGNKARSAAECCRMCKEHQAKGDVPHRCNVWVWCGDPSGVCWTMDIHHHTTGDCWLKYQASWDGDVDMATTNLEINHRGKFSDKFRAEHKTAPEAIPWVAGLVSRKKGP